MDFTGFDLACISGANGAGKSSLLDGITWALFGQARKRDDALIHSQADTAEVVFTFEYESNVYRVQRVKRRDKTTLLEFHIQAGEGDWKALTERTLRATEERIRDTMRLDYETFVNASFFLQGKADQFTQQRPGDRKRILSSILGLEVWESYRQVANQRRRGLDGEMKGLDGRLQEIQTELGEGPQRKKRLKELETSLERLSKARASHEAGMEEMRRAAASLAEQEKLVSTLAEQLGRNEDRVEDLERRVEERRGEQAGFTELLASEEKIEKDYKAWQEMQAELARWDEVAVRFHEHEGLRLEPLTEIEGERARLETELKQLREQAKAIGKSDGEIKDLGGQWDEGMKEVEAAELKLAERAERDVELARALEAKARAETENPILREEMDKLKQRLDQLENTKEPDCPVCGQALTDEHRASVTEELRGEGTRMGDAFRENQKVLTEADAEVERLRALLEGMEGVEEGLRTLRRSSDQIKDRMRGLEAEREKWAKTGEKKLAELEASLAEEAFAPEARKKLDKVNAELKKIGYDAGAHDEARANEKAGRSADESMRALEKAKAAAAPLEREIGELETELVKQRKEIEQQRKDHDAAAANLAAAQSQAPDVSGAERELLRLQEEENEARREEGGARQMVEVLESLTGRKQELEAKREEIAQQISRLRGLERAFGKDGVPAMLIEQALPQIEIQANEVLERLSAGEMAIDFITQQEYKDKSRDDLKETLDIQIRDRAGIRDYEMYSGGEAFRINFAIRLALSEVLAQRAGARLQTLVIDEGFGSQDEIGRQRLVEAINLVKENFAKILVITHVEALKEAFPQRVEIEKTLSGSQITLR